MIVARAFLFYSTLHVGRLLVLCRSLAADAAHSDHSRTAPGECHCDAIILRARASARHPLNPLLALG